MGEGGRSKDDPEGAPLESAGDAGNPTAQDDLDWVLPKFDEFEEFDDALEEEGEEVEAKHLLPAKYASPTTSGLSADVQKGMDPVDLALTSSESE